MHHAALLAKKSDCFKFIIKGDIYHQMSNCIKSWILIVFGLLSDCLFFARQKFCYFQFLVAIASNYYPLTETSLIDIFVNYKPNLSLFNQIEKWLLILLGKIGSSSNDHLCSSWVFKEFCISFSAKQHIVFFILWVFYQHLSIQLVSTFRRRRRSSNRARFQSHGFEIGINYTSRPQCIFLFKFYLDMFCIHWQLNG